MKNIRLCSLLFIFLFFSNNLAQAQTTKAKIAVGAAQSIVLKEDGSVYTFGTNAFGVLGQGKADRGDIPTALDNTNYSGKTISAISTSIDGSSSQNFSLLLATDGSVYVFGNNNYGQLGLGDETSRAIPTLLTHAAIDTATIVAVSAGATHSLLLSDKGTVFVMGDNDNGYAGINSTSPSEILTPTPINMSPLAGEKVVKISAGENFSLALTEDNHLFGWGRNINGQIGDSTITLRTSPVQIPDRFFEGKTIVDIIACAGSASSMMLTSDGTVYSWGSKRAHLGREPEDVDDVTYPTVIDMTNLSGKTITGISRGYESSLLLASDGSVFGFGVNYGGNLGLGDKTSRAIATQIPPEYFQNKSIVEVNVGYFHSLFRATDGTMFGVGGSGSSGYTSVTGTGYQGNFLYKPLPINTSNMAGKTITHFATGARLSLALSSDGTVFSFGANNAPLVVQGVAFKYIGRNAVPVFDTPTLLNHSNLNGKTIVDVKAGGLATFLLTDDGKVFSFGRGTTGNLGLGDSVDVYEPTLISHSNIAGKHIIDVSSSMYSTPSSGAQAHTLLLADDGTVFSMGSNGCGQLGLGDFVNRFVPTQITSSNLNGKFITKIVANAQTSLLIASDGSVFIWGVGGSGEMGFGNSDTLNVPTLYTHANLGGKAIRDAAIGTNSYSATNRHFLLLAEDSTVYSFGTNTDGQLGIGNKNIVPYTPTQVAGALAGKKVIAIKAGYQSTSMALTADGKIYSWGKVQSVGFNTSSFIGYSNPTLVTSTDLDKRLAVAIAINEKHSLALMQDGTVLSFGYLGSGYSDYGAFGTGGDGTYSDQKLPVKIPDFTASVPPFSTTNLVLHLDAGKGIITSGDTLNTWSDLSGLSHNGTETGSKRPQVVDSAFGIHRGIRFDGTTKYVTLPTTATLGIQSHDYEVFIVAKSSSSSIMFLLAGGLGEFELHLNGSAGARFIPITGAHYVDIGASGDYTDGTTRLYNASANSSMARVAVNRSETSIAADWRSSYAGSLYLGIRGTNDYPFVGDIAEVIIYSDVLSAEDRKKAETYLSDKYQIALPDEKSVSITGNEGWRLLASPAKDSTYGSFFRSIWTQGITGADYESGTPNIYTWPKTSIGRDSVEWIPLSSMNVTYPIGQGSLVYVFSDDNGSGGEGDAGFPKTFTTDGLISSGDQDLSSLLNTNTNGWTLLGNPFTSAIDWDLFKRTNINNAVYVWNPSSSEWKSWNGSIGGLTDGKIGAINGFFVQTNATDPSLTIPSSAKVSGESFLGKKTAENTTAFNITLSNSKGLKNQAWIQFAEDANTGLDSKDAVKLAPFSNDYVQIGTVLANGKVLDINYLPNSLAEIEIPLEIKSTHYGVHTISLDRHQFPESWTVKLWDNQTGIESDLAEAYTFNWTSAPAKQVVMDAEHKPSVAIQSQSSSRFSLRIGGITTAVEESIKAYSFSLAQNYPNPFNPSTTISFSLPKAQHINLEVFDVTGRRVATLVNESKAAGKYVVVFNASRLSSGMYFYRLSSNAGTITKKLVLIK